MLRTSSETWTRGTRSSATFGRAKAHEGIHHDQYDGERTCRMCLPRAKRRTRIDDLNFQPDSESIGGGRWYPTVVALADGEGFGVGGHPSADDSYPSTHPSETSDTKSGNP
jgi:hypothetical protein